MVRGARVQSVTQVSNGVWASCRVSIRCGVESCHSCHSRYLWSGSYSARRVRSTKVGRCSSRRDLTPPCSCNEGRWHLLWNVHIHPSTCPGPRPSLPPPTRGTGASRGMEETTTIQCCARLQAARVFKPLFSSRFSRRNTTKQFRYSTSTEKHAFPIQVYRGTSTARRFRAVRQPIRCRTMHGSHSLHDHEAG